jgi:hypothetical protein
MNATPIQYLHAPVSGRRGIYSKRAFVLVVERDQSAGRAVALPHLGARLKQRFDRGEDVTHCQLVAAMAT